MQENKIILEWKEVNDLIKLDTSNYSKYIKIIGKINSNIRKGGILAIIDDSPEKDEISVTQDVRNNQQKVIKSPITGKILKLDLDELVIEKCQHHMFFGNLCADCGQGKADTVKHSYLSMSQTIYFSQKKAKSIENELIEKLKESKKLILLLDIDNTILHSVNSKSRVNVSLINELQKSKEKQINLVENNENNEQSILSDKQSDDQIGKVSQLTNITIKKDNNEIEDSKSNNCAKIENNKNLEVKEFTIDKTNNNVIVSFRPNLRLFLEKISPYFEIYVYTMGIESYISPILTHLNKELSHEYFKSNKVIARDSSFNDITHKSINKIFPSNHDFCLVLDDRLDVWAEVDSVIKIFPYWHFEDSPCGSVKRNKTKEDCFLEVSSIIMIYIWNQFFINLMKGNSISAKVSKTIKMNY